jgi:parallel beta-helix repeat protein
MRMLVVAALLIATTARAAVVTVEEGQSIQAAIDGAQSGDTIAVGPGTFEGDLDFKGKAVVVRGAGPETVVRGSGTTSVVTFVTDEGPDSVLDSVTITNGSSDRGGGIFADLASPTIVRTFIVRNRVSTFGSAVYLERSTARLYNNVVAYNTSVNGADTHQIHLVNASPTIVNNTVTNGDSNGIFVTGPQAFPTIRNNILSFNGGHPRGKPARGRGICDLGPGTVIQWNLFFRNLKAALLTSGNVDYRKVRRAERVFAEPRLADNVDGPPRFVSPGKMDFGLRKRSRALHAGDPDPEFADLDGARNTMGHLGGPYAAPSPALP